MSKQKLTYKSAAEELESIVEKMESAELEIDDLSAQVKRAKELVTFCKEKLTSRNS